MQIPQNLEVKITVKALIWSQASQEKIRNYHVICKYSFPVVFFFFMMYTKKNKAVLSTIAKL